MKKILLNVSLCLLCLSVANVYGEIIAFEDFDGGMVGYEGTGWNRVTTQTDGEIAPGFGNYALAVSSGDSNRYMTTSIDLEGDGVYYMAMLFRCTDIYYQGMKLLEGGGNINQTSILFTNTPSSDGLGGELEIFYQAAHQYPRTNYYPNVTYLTVMKLTCSTTGSDSMQMAVYDLNGDVVPMAEPTTWTLEELGLAFNRDSCNVVTLLCQAAQNSQFDNVMMATEWSDVASLYDITHVSVDEDDNSGNVTFDVALNAEPASYPVTVDIACSDPNVTTFGNPAYDLEIPTTSLTFNSAAAQPVTLKGVDNADIDGDRKYTLILTADNDNSGLVTPQMVYVTVVDDDQPVVTTNISAIEVAENDRIGISNTSSFEISVFPAPPVGEDIVVTLSESPDPNSLVMTPKTVTFTNSSTGPVTINVTAIDDTTINSAVRPYQDYVKVISLTLDDPALPKVNNVLVTVYEDDCGANGYDLADVTKDCIVDLQDFAMMAAQWLTCNYPNMGDGCL